VTHHTVVALAGATGSGKSSVGGPEDLTLHPDGRVVPVVAVPGVDDVITWQEE